MNRLETLLAILAAAMIILVVALDHTYAYHAKEHTAPNLLYDLTVWDGNGQRIMRLDAPVTFERCRETRQMLMGNLYLYEPQWVITCTPVNFLGA